MLKVLSKSFTDFTSDLTHFLHDVVGAQLNIGVLRHSQGDIKLHLWLKGEIRRFPLLRSGDGAINCSGPKTRQHVLICRYGEGASNKGKSHTKEMRVAMQM